MALRLGSRAISFKRKNAAMQFTTFVKPLRTQRIVLQPPRAHSLNTSPAVFRRYIFGLRKQTTESATKTVRTFAEMCYRFTVYSGVFVAITIAGFFIYDVLPAPRNWINNVVSNISSTRGI